MNSNLHNEDTNKLNDDSNSTNRSNPKSRDAERIRSVIKRSEGVALKIRDNVENNEQNSSNNFFISDENNSNTTFQVPFNPNVTNQNIGIGGIQKEQSENPIENSMSSVESNSIKLDHQYSAQKNVLKIVPLNQIVENPEESANAINMEVRTSINISNENIIKEQVNFTNKINDQNNDGVKKIFITKNETLTKPIELTSSQNLNDIQNDNDINNPKSVIDKVGNMPKKRNPIYTAAVILLGLATGLALYVIGSEQIAKYFPKHTEDIDGTIGQDLLSKTDSLLAEEANFVENHTIVKSDSSTINFSNDEGYKIPYPNENGESKRANNNEYNSDQKIKNDNKSEPTAINPHSQQTNGIPDIRGDREFNNALNNTQIWKEPKTKIPSINQEKSIKNEDSKTIKNGLIKEERNTKDVASKFKNANAERMVTDISSKDISLKEKSKITKSNISKNDISKNDISKNDISKNVVSKNETEKNSAVKVIDKKNKIADNSVKANLSTKDASKTKYVVQVQATSDQSEAKRVAQQLKAKGIKGVTIMPSDVNGKRTYRVRFGASGTAKQAQLDAEKAGYKKSWIIPNK